MSQTFPGTEGGEKWQTLDVIPMGVRDQQMAVDRLCPLQGQSLPKPMRTCTAVEDDQRIVRRAHFDT